MRVLRRILVVLGGVVVVFAVMQLVPYGRAHSNPPSIREPAWDSPATRELAVRACFDCHSNETEWPWYSHVAPFSWTIQRRVEVGRTVLNFSEWTRPYELASQAAPVVIRRDMPPRSYRWFHPTSRLTHAERLLLARGLSKTLGLEWRE